MDEVITRFATSGVSTGSGVLHHLVDLGIRKGKHGGDRDRHLLDAALVLDRDAEGAVGVDVEGDLDLRHDPGSRRDSTGKESSGHDR